MRPHGVVVLTPTLDDNFCFGARAEPFEAEAFVAELAVEALGDAILPGLAGLDQRGANEVLRLLRPVDKVMKFRFWNDLLTCRIFTTIGRRICRR